jgi:hypothetical protein
MHVRWVGLSVSLLVGCATVESAREDRRDKLKTAERLLDKVPIAATDGVELRFQLAELKLLDAEDLEGTGQTEAADQRRYEAGLLLDELLAKAPSSPRIPEIATSRANVAVLRRRHQEAVVLVRRALELGGHDAQNLRFLQAALPRELRLAGDCAGALACPIPTGTAGQSTHLERAACLRDAPEQACDELLATLGSDPPAPRLVRALRVALTSMSAPATCLERFPPEVRSSLSEAQPDAGR